MRQKTHLGYPFLERRGMGTPTRQDPHPGTMGHVKADFRGPMGVVTLIAGGAAGGYYAVCLFRARSG